MWLVVTGPSHNSEQPVKLQNITLSASGRRPSLKRPSDLITITEAAALREVDASTVRRWVLSGRLQGYPLNTRLTLVSRRAVEKFERAATGPKSHG